MGNRFTNEIARVYDNLGGNEAYERLTPTQLNRIHDLDETPIEGLAYAPPFFIAPILGTLGALFDISTKWIFNLPSDAFWASWYVNTRNDDKTAKIASEKRFGNRWGHYVLGAPSLAISLPIAFAIGTIVIALRSVFKHSWITAYNLFVAPNEYALGTDLKTVRRNLLEVDNRHWLIKSSSFVLGGFVGLVGIVPAALILAARKGYKFPLETLKALFITPLQFIKAVSPKGSLLDFNLSNAKVNYLVGFPGTIAGAAIGAVLASPIVAVRMITNTAKVFYHFTKVAINWGLERDIFADVYLENVATKDARFKVRSSFFTLNAADIRFGFLGVFPLALISFALATVFLRIPRALNNALLRTGLFPFAALKRLGDEGYKLAKGQRLDPNKRGALDNVDYEVLRRIYANVGSSTGEIDKNLPLTPRAPGASEIGGGFWRNLFTPRNYVKFFRKAAYFNWQTLDETFLAKVYQNLSETHDHAKARLEKKLNSVTALITETNEKMKGITQKIQSIEGGNSKFDKFFKLRDLKSDLDKLTKKNQGYEAEKSLLEREQAYRTDTTVTPGVTTDRLIDLSVEQIQATYMDDNTLFTAPIEKETNDKTLAKLAAFVKAKLKEGRAKVSSEVKGEDAPPPYVPSEWKEPIHAQARSFLLQEPSHAGGLSFLRNFQFRKPSAPAPLNESLDPNFATNRI